MLEVARNIVYHPDRVVETVMQVDYQNSFQDKVTKVKSQVEAEVTNPSIQSIMINDSIDQHQVPGETTVSQMNYDTNHEVDNQSHQHSISGLVGDSSLDITKVNESVDQVKEAS